MFARVKKSGLYEYLQIVQNRREGTKTIQRVVATIGRMDQVQQKGEIARLRLGRVAEADLDRTGAPIRQSPPRLEDHMVDQALPQPAQESMRMLDGKANEEFAQADAGYLRAATKIASSRFVGVQDAQAINIDDDGASGRGPHESAHVIAGPRQGIVRSVASGRIVQLLLLSEAVDAAGHFGADSLIRRPELLRRRIRADPVDVEDDRYHLCWRRMKDSPT